MSTPLSGPRGMPLLGCLPQYARDPLAFFAHAGHDFGEISQFRVVSQRVYMLNHPRHIEALLVGQYRDCVKDQLTRALMPMVGRGLLTSEGDLWRRQRRLAAPPLQPRRIARYADTMVETAARTAVAFRDHEVRNISAEMMRLTLEIVSRTLFSQDRGKDAEVIAAALDDLIEYMVEQMRSLRAMLPTWVPTRSRRRMRAAVRRIDAIIYDMIEKRRGGAEDQDDMLSRLLYARDTDGGRMSDVQLRDELVTMMLAGHETTALALTFALHLLSEHPKIRGQLQEEREQVLGTREPTLEDLEHLKLAGAVVREALRLYPPAYAIGREAIKDLTIDGHTIPAGAQILVSQWAVHRDPRFFADPNSFRPARWLDPQVENLPRFAYFPFGGGPRVCIGNHFAMMEATLVLTTLLQQVELTTLPGTRLKLQPAVTLRLEEPLRMIVRRQPRRPARSSSRARDEQTSAPATPTSASMTES